MNEVKFADAVYQASSVGGVVKIEFVNLGQKDESLEITNKFGVALTMSSFLKLKETIDDLHSKLFPKEELKELKEEKAPSFAKVSSSAKGGRKKKA